ncbi:hypothetical protein V6N13_008651 [Hibiscus sabdariffa]
MAPKGTCRGRSTRVGQVARAALKRNFHRAAGRILCRRLKYAMGYFPTLVKIFPRQPSLIPDVCSLLGYFIVPSGCGVPSLIVSSAPRSNLSLVWVVDRWVWMLLLVRNGHVSGEMVVCVDRLRASCIELSSRTPLQFRPLVVVVPKG